MRDNMEKAIFPTSFIKLANLQDSKKNAIKKAKKEREKINARK